MKTHIGRGCTFSTDAQREIVRDVKQKRWTACSQMEASSLSARNGIVSWKCCSSRLFIVNQASGTRDTPDQAPENATLISARIKYFAARCHFIWHDHVPVMSSIMVGEVPAVSVSTNAESASTHHVREVRSPRPAERA